MLDTAEERLGFMNLPEILKEKKQKWKVRRTKKNRDATAEAAKKRLKKQKQSLGCVGGREPVILHRVEPRRGRREM